MMNNYGEDLTQNKRQHILLVFVCHLHQEYFVRALKHNLPLLQSQQQ